MNEKNLYSNPQKLTGWTPSKIIGEALLNKIRRIDPDSNRKVESAEDPSLGYQFNNPAIVLKSLDCALQHLIEQLENRKQEVITECCLKTSTLIPPSIMGFLKQEYKEPTFKIITLSAIASILDMESSWVLVTTKAEMATFLGEQGYSIVDCLANSPSNYMVTGPGQMRNSVIRVLKRSNVESRVGQLAAYSEDTTIGQAALANWSNYPEYWVLIPSQKVSRPAESVTSRGFDAHELPRQQT